MYNKPHIVIFNPDEYRWDVLGHLNKAAITPNADALVEKSAVSFTNSYCQHPICIGSRCSYLTGWYVHVMGHRTGRYFLQPHEPMLLRDLKNAGYHVWWGGKNDVLPGGFDSRQYCNHRHLPSAEVMENLHYDLSWRSEPGSKLYYSFYAGKLRPEGRRVNGIEVYYDEDWDHVCAAVDLIRSYDGEAPLCIYLPLAFPHPPYAVEDPWYSVIDRNSLPERIKLGSFDGKPAILKEIWKNQRLQELTEEDWNELRAVYYGMCARVDYQFGMVLDALKDSGIFDETVVFFFSDHGDFAGDYGLVEKTSNTFEDCISKVPLIIKPPAAYRVKPAVVDCLVELVDIPATVEDMLGLHFDHTHFGKSLVPLLQGETREHRDAVFCEGGRLNNEEHCTGHHRSSYEPGQLYWPRLSAELRIPEDTKAVMVRTKEHKYVYRLYENDELYALASDPQEKHNLIDNKAYRSVMLRLKEMMLRFLVETGDVVPHKLEEREGDRNTLSS